MSITKLSVKNIAEIAKNKLLGNSTIFKAYQPRDSKGRFISLTNLQSLLNIALHDQIQKNMGKGKAKKTLNYRTGRFAKSVKITGLQQRGDKIIAFYDYMRYPYKTFSKGGQKYIPSRTTPEFIINKSIRQLAKQVVYSKFKMYPKLGENI